MQIVTAASIRTTRRDHGRRNRAAQRRPRHHATAAARLGACLRGRGFSSLGTIDRIVYDNYEPIVALAAAAAVTERIRLATTVMLGPLRMNAAMVAKQVLSLDTLAGGGRAVLGFGLGGRDDDYEISDADMSGRGRWQDQAVAQIRQIFDGQDGDAAKVGPRPPRSGPSLIIGGSVEATFERAARWGDGWIMGGGTPDQFRAAAEQLNAAWSTARPRWPASTCRSPTSRSETTPRPTPTSTCSTTTASWARSSAG